MRVCVCVYTRMHPCVCWGIGQSRHEAEGKLTFRDQMGAWYIQVQQPLRLGRMDKTGVHKLSSADTRPVYPRGSSRWGEPDLQKWGLEERGRQPALGTK